MLATLPSATSTIQSISEVANPWMSEFWPWIYLSLGIILASTLIVYLRDLIPYLFYRINFDESKNAGYFDKHGKFKPDTYSSYHNRLH